MNYTTENKKLNTNISKKKYNMLLKQGDQKTWNLTILAEKHGFF